jgi:N-terminal region of glycosyl transferase group 7/N-terminal domain of galactosyltransferase/Sulfotransferase family
MTMLLTTSRSRHHAPFLGTPTSSDHHHEHGKYSKHGKAEGPSCAARLQCWSWIICGIVCTGMALDYSLRSSLLLVQTVSTSSALDTSESILAPLESRIPTTTSAASTTTTTNNIRRQDDGYRFDNLAFVKPNPLRHAILIPYRDRPFHLELFLEYMGPYLQRHFPHAHFTLWIVEQDDQELFNRAWLANVGLKEIVRQAPETSCVIFHDVDLVPNMTSHVPYTTCQWPTQLGSELQHFNWSIPYPAYCGGITSLSLRHWQLINGLGNDYIGWGGEDDDLYHRLRQNGLLWQNPNDKTQAPVPRRPPKGNGVFRTISQKAEHHEQKKTHNQYYKSLELLKEMHENSDRWKYDGLSDVYYTVTATKQVQPGLGFALYNHIKAIPQKQRDGTIKYHENPEGTPSTAEGNAPLEFVHVPYTGGQAITEAAAKANIVWGACHFGQFDEWKCPVGKSGDFQHTPMQFKASYQQALKPWHIPLMRFLENPMEGTKRFTVVRHPYSRAISFYRFTYDSQHGYPHGFKYHNIVEDRNHPPEYVANYLRDREHPAKLNSFLQDFLIREHHPHRPDGVELIPQVQFVFHRGLKYVHHVLHYEFLMRDFKNILEKYQLTDVVDLPPPERKRKRKKQVVKKYEEKQVPQVTWMTPYSLLTRFYRLLGLGDAKPRVVDMSLSEIEDEYLLGAQDLEDVTIAMLNDHFDLDFRKFHYAKIKVNATSESFWSPIQIIPRDSELARMQNERNNVLSRQTGQKQAAGPAHVIGPARELTKKQTELQTKRLQEVAKMITNKNKSLPASEKSKVTNLMRDKDAPDTDKSKERTADTNRVETEDKSDPYFKERKKRLEDRMKEKDAERAANMQDSNGAEANGGPRGKTAMQNMREIAERLRKPAAYNAR